MEPGCETREHLPQPGQRHPVRGGQHSWARRGLLHAAVSRLVGSRLETKLQICHLGIIKTCLLKDRVLTEINPGSTTDFCILMPRYLKS